MCLIACRWSATTPTAITRDPTQTATTRDPGAKRTTRLTTNEWWRCRIELWYVYSGKWQSIHWLSFILRSLWTQFLMYTQPSRYNLFCLTTSYIEWVVQWDLNNEHLNKENIWITNFTCFLLPLIVCYSSHDLNIELSKLNVCYSSSQSDKLSVKQPMTWKTQF